jgi:hypothetical protein
LFPERLGFNPNIAAGIRNVSRREYRGAEAAEKIFFLCELIFHCELCVKLV